MIQQLQNVGNLAVSIDTFMKACTEARSEVEIKKNVYKAEKKQMAVTSPEQ